MNRVCLMDPRRGTDRCLAMHSCVVGHACVRPMPDVHAVWCLGAPIRLLPLQAEVGDSPLPRHPWHRPRAPRPSPRQPCPPSPPTPLRNFPQPIDLALSTWLRPQLARMHLGHPCQVRLDSPPRTRYCCSKRLRPPRLLWLRQLHTRRCSPATAQSIVRPRSSVCPARRQVPSRIPTPPQPPCRLAVLNQRRWAQHTEPRSPQMVRTRVVVATESAS